MDEKMRADLERPVKQGDISALPSLMRGFARAGMTLYEWVPTILKHRDEPKVYQAADELRLTSVSDHVGTTFAEVYERLEQRGKVLPTAHAVFFAFRMDYKPFRREGNLRLLRESLAIVPANYSVHSKHSFYLVRDNPFESFPEAVPTVGPVVEPMDRRFAKKLEAMAKEEAALAPDLRTVQQYKGMVPLLRKRKNSCSEILLLH